MQVLSLHHVNIRVDDVDKAIDFYTKVFGMGIRKDRPDSPAFPGVWLQAGGQQIHLSVGPVPEQMGQHFALEVADLPEAVAELEAAGIEVRSVSPIQSVIYDPAGNLLELRQG
jgi:glyoxylase I family protein